MSLTRRPAVSDPLRRPSTGHRYDTIPTVGDRRSKPRASSTVIHLSSPCTSSRNTRQTQSPTPIPHNQTAPSSPPLVRPVEPATSACPTNHHLPTPATRSPWSRPAARGRPAPARRRRQISSPPSPRPARTSSSKPAAPAWASSCGAPNPATWDPRAARSRWRASRSSRGSAAPPPSPDLLPSSPISTTAWRHPSSHILKTALIPLLSSLVVGTRIVAQWSPARRLLRAASLSRPSPRMASSTPMRVLRA